MSPYAINYELPPILVLSFNQKLQRFWRQTFHSEIFDQEVESFVRQSFGEDVCKLIVGFDEVKFDNSIFDLLLDKMVSYIDVLGS